MSASAEQVVRAAFPRVVKNTEEGGNLGRGIFAGIFDAASFPGRGYASLWNRYNEPMLEGMARTGANPNSPLALSVAEGIARDPLTLLSAPIGGLAGGAGRTIASRLGGEIAERTIPFVADAVANAGTAAASQYGTEGRVNLADLAMGIGADLGLQGAGAAISKMTPTARAKILDNPNFWAWFGDSKVVDEAGKPLTVYHGTDKSFESFDPEKLGSLTGAESAKKGFFFTNNPENADFYAGWTPSKEGYDYVTDLVKRKEDDVRSIQSEFEEMRRANRRVRRVDKDSFLSDAQLVDAGYLREEIPELRKEWDYSPEEIAVYNRGKELSKRLADAESALDVAKTLAVSNSIGRDFSAGVTPNVMPVNLALKNPLIHQQAGDFRDITFSDLLDRAKSLGNDGVIIRGTQDPLRGDVFVALSPTQIKSATGNRGTFDLTDPNITHFSGGSIPIAGVNALGGRYLRGVLNAQDGDEKMKGEDLGADWGNDAIPVGGDLGADWGNDLQTARRKPPERVPVADTAQQRTAQAVAAFMAQKPTKPEDRAQAAARQQLPSGYDGAMQALFPRSYAQIGEEGGADFWTNLKDAWSLPGRATVATVGALADLAGSAVANAPRELRGEGDAVASGDEALSNAWDTFRREMVDPSGLMGGAAPGASNMVAGVMKDPLLPVLSAIAPAPAGQMFAGLGKFAPAARASATATEATVPVLGIQALEKAGTGEELGAGDMAAAFGLSFAPTLAGEALPVAAPWLNKVAKERFTAGIKPRQRTGKEAEGLEKFLEAGGLPKVAGPTNLQWNRPASRFFQILDEKAGPEYQRVLSAADATATAMPGTSGMVPKSKMAEGIEQGIIDFATEHQGAFTKKSMEDAKIDVLDRLKMAGADAETMRNLVFGAGDAVAPEYLLPSQAHRLKSGLAADAYRRKEMSRAVEVAEEGAASAAREILGQKYPEIAALNQQWSPWYAARQAMETARQRGANRGFFTNLRNFPESPGFSRVAYEAGRAAGAAGPVLQRFNPLAIPALQIANQNR